MTTSATQFVNFSKEAFEVKWDGKVWKIEAGAKETVETGIALHFTRHLVDREMHKAKLPINDLEERSKLEKKALGKTIEADSVEELYTKMARGDIEDNGTPPESSKSAQAEQKKLQKEAEKRAKAEEAERKKNAPANRDDDDFAGKNDKK